MDVWGEGKQRLEKILKAFKGYHQYITAAYATPLGSFFHFHLLARFYSLLFLCALPHHLHDTLFYHLFIHYSLFRHSLPHSQSLHSSRTILLRYAWRIQDQLPNPFHFFIFSCFLFPPLAFWFSLHPCTPLVTLH